jgi:hypothetical protein
MNTPTRPGREGRWHEQMNDAQMDGWKLFLKCELIHYLCSTMYCVWLPSFQEPCNKQAVLNLHSDYHGSPFFSLLEI